MVTKNLAYLIIIGTKMTKYENKARRELNPSDYACGQRMQAGIPLREDIGEVFRSRFTPKKLPPVPKGSQQKH